MYIFRLFIPLLVLFHIHAAAAAETGASNEASSQPAPQWTGPSTFRAAEADLGRLFFAKKGEDTIELRAVDVPYERVIEALAGNENLGVYFFCSDPTQRTELVTTRLRGKSFREILVEAITEVGEDFGLSYLDEHGDPTAELKQAAVIHASTAGCPREALPLRIFRPLRSAHPILNQPVNEITVEDLAHVLETEGPAARRTAVRLLAQMRTDESIALVKDALDDPDPEVVVEASKSLTRAARTQKVEGAAEALYQALQRRPYFQVAVDLVGLDKDKAWPVIETMTQSDDEAVRSVAVRAIVSADDPRGLDFLATMVTEAEAGTAQQAAWAIGRTGGERAATKLRDLLDLEDPLRQALAAQAISMLDDPHKAYAQEKLIRIIEQPDAPREVLRALVTIDYAEPLVQLMADPHASAETKIEVLKLIAETERGSLDTLRVALDDPDPAVRLAAVEAVAALEVPESVPLLIDATKDADPPVRLEAVRGLGELGHDLRTTQAMAKLFSDEDEDVRTEAVAVLAQWGDPERDVIDVLLRAADQKDGAVSKRAYEILHYWGYK